MSAVEFPEFVEADDWIRLVGMRQIRKALKEAGDDLSDLKSLNKQAAQIAAAGAAALVPVRTGALKNTIRPSGTATAATVRVGTRKVAYAHAIQWGRRVWPSKASPAPRSGRKKYNAFIKPSLFLTAGAKHTEPEWVALYEKELAQQLDKIGDST